VVEERSAVDRNDTNVVKVVSLGVADLAGARGEGSKF
jgi:hypothetical protein